MRKKPIGSRTVKVKKSYTSRGYLKTVRNEKGTKRNLVIAEDRDGYTASYPTQKGGEHIVAKTKSNPEQLAVSLAKKGHGEVEIMD